MSIRQIHMQFTFSKLSTTSTTWTSRVNPSISDATHVPQPKSTQSQTIEMSSASTNFDLQCECPGTNQINRKTPNVKYIYQLHMLYGSRKLIIKKSGARSQNSFFESTLRTCDPHPSKSKLWTGLKQVKLHPMLIRIGAICVLFSKKFWICHSHFNLRNVA